MNSLSAAAETASTRWTRGAVDLRSGALHALILRLPDPRDPAFYPALAEKVCQAPNFYKHAPVIVDLSDLAESPPFNIAEIGRRLRQHWLVPIGVQNGTDEQNQAALNAGLGVFVEGQPAAWSSPEESEAEPQATAAPTAGSAAKTVTQPVRSGRQIYAQGGDLVVMASVGAGAEILADGHIHVYGALRGRALAGVSGDDRARILCSSLEAELLSIAGVWITRDHIPNALVGGRAQVLLDGDRVRVEPLP